MIQTLYTNLENQWPRITTQGPRVARKIVNVRQKSRVEHKTTSTHADNLYLDDIGQLTVSHDPAITRSPADRRPATKASPSPPDCCCKRRYLAVEAGALSHEIRRRSNCHWVWRAVLARDGGTRSIHSLIAISGIYHTHTRDIPKVHR